MQRPIGSRRDLITALSVAAELEHGLSCQYLYAAFSLRKWIDDRTQPELSAKARDWASTLLLVAREEMEHLGMVYNLLTAVGGVPHLDRPNFPQPAEQYGNLTPFQLRPFSLEALDDFITYERPEALHLREVSVEALESPVTTFEDAAMRLVKTICRETQWEFGAAATIDDHLLKFLEDEVWLEPERSGSNILGGKQIDTKDHPKFFSLDCTGKGPKEIPFGSRLEDTPLFRERTQSDELGFNAVTSIPVCGADGRVLLMLVFGYDVYRDPREDDQLIEVVNEAIHGGESTERTIPQILAAKRHPEMDTASTFKRSKRLEPLRVEVATLGGLYRRIRKGIIRLDREKKDRLFIGSGDAQVSNPDIGLPDRSFHNLHLHTVSMDANSALKIIERIIESGEGTPSKDEETSHYRRFCAMRDEAESSSKTIMDSMSVVRNPVIEERPDSCGNNVHYIEHPITRDVAVLFDAVYEITLVMLEHYFSSDKKSRQVNALGYLLFKPLMGMILRPLGEILTVLPMAENDADERTAGPCFEVRSDISAYPGRTVMWPVFLERLDEMEHACARLVAAARDSDKQAINGIEGRLANVHRSLQLTALRVKEQVERHNVD